MFGNIEFEKSKFYPNKTILFCPIFWEMQISKKYLVSNKISFGEKVYKYFIGNKNIGNYFSSGNVQKKSMLYF